MSNLTEMQNKLKQLAETNPDGTHPDIDIMMQLLTKLENLRFFLSKEGLEGLEVDQELVETTLKELTQCQEELLNCAILVKDIPDEGTTTTDHE